MARILVVEDHADVRALVVETLTGAGHEVHGAGDGLAARAAIGDARPDLVVLDLMLPYLDGSVLIPEFREAGVPILVLSAKDAVHTKVDILRLGADDYITKPFDLAELEARVEVLLRRGATEAPGDPTLRHGVLVLDRSTARVSLAGTDVALTATEFHLLEMLLESPGAVLSRRVIYETVWGEPFRGDDGAVKTHVSNLRAKLKAAAPHEDPIETVWGLGYRLRHTET